MEKDKRDLLPQTTAAESLTLETGTLLAFFTSLTAAESLENLAEHVVVRTRELLAADRAMLILADQADRQISLIATAGFAADGHQQMGYEEFAAGITGWVVKHKVPTITNDLRRDKRNRGKALMAALSEPSATRGKALVAVPLLVGEQAWGVLGLINNEGSRSFTSDDLNLLTAIAAQTAASSAKLATLAASEAQQNDLEQQLARQTETLDQANLMLADLAQRNNKFIQDITHQLKTPITSLRLTLDLLHTKHPEMFAQYLSRIDAQTNWLQQLINDILKLATLGKHEYLMARHRVDLNQTLGAVISQLQPGVDREKTELRFQPEANLPYIIGHEGYIRHIATNLLDNALKYAPEGQILVRSFRLQDETGLKICFSVTDEGNGIAAEHLSHVFQRFYRVQRSASNTLSGSGIGLALAKELVEQQGGEISVRSQLGQGSEFTVKFPAVQEEEA